MGKRNLVAVVKLTNRISKQQRSDLAQSLSDAGERMGIDFVVAEEGMDVEMHHDLSPLLDAIGEQTDAIRALAESNQMLAQAMMEDELDDDGPTVGHLGQTL